MRSQFIDQFDHPLRRLTCPASVFLSQLAGAKVYFYLDLRYVCSQLSVSPDCHHVLVVASPLAHFWFCHLIFGVSSVSELFQSKMQQIPAGCEGGFIHLDDSHILAASQKGHDHFWQAADIVLATYDVILCNGKCR